MEGSIRGQTNTNNEDRGDDKPDNNNTTTSRVAAHPWWEPRPSVDEQPLRWWEKSPPAETTTSASITPAPAPPPPPPAGASTKTTASVKAKTTRQQGETRKEMEPVPVASTTRGDTTEKTKEEKNEGLVPTPAPPSAKPKTTQQRETWKDEDNSSRSFGGGGARPPNNQSLMHSSASTNNPASGTKTPKKKKNERLVAHQKEQEMTTTTMATTTSQAHPYDNNNKHAVNDNHKESGVNHKVIVKAGLYEKNDNDPLDRSINNNHHQQAIIGTNPTTSTTTAAASTTTPRNSTTTAATIPKMFTSLKDETTATKPTPTPTHLELFINNRIFKVPRAGSSGRMPTGLPHHSSPSGGQDSPQQQQQQQQQKSKPHHQSVTPIILSLLSLVCGAYGVLGCHLVSAYYDQTKYSCWVGYYSSACGWKDIDNSMGSCTFAWHPHMSISWFVAAVCLAPFTLFLHLVVCLLQIYHKSFVVIIDGSCCQSNPTITSREYKATAWYFIILTLLYIVLMMVGNLGRYNNFEYDTDRLEYETELGPGTMTMIVASVITSCIAMLSLFCGQILKDQEMWDHARENNNNELNVWQDEVHT